MRKLGFPSPFCGSASIFSSSFQHLPFPRRGLRAWQAQGSEGWRAWDPRSSVHGAHAWLALS